MKTVTTTCDQCLAVIHQVDIITGMKYLAEYVKHELTTGGSKREFCSMHCLQNFIKLDNPVAPSIAPVLESSPQGVPPIG